MALSGMNIVVDKPIRSQGDHGDVDEVVVLSFFVLRRFATAAAADRVLFLSGRLDEDDDEAS